MTTKERVQFNMVAWLAANSFTSGEKSSPEKGKQSVALIHSNPYYYMQHKLVKTEQGTLCLQAHTTIQKQC